MVKQSADIKLRWENNQVAMRECSYLVKWNAPSAMEEMTELKNKVFSPVEVDLWNYYATRINNYLDMMEKSPYYNKKEVWGPCTRGHLHLPKNMDQIPATIPYRLELSEQLMDLEDWIALQKMSEGMI